MWSVRAVAPTLVSFLLATGGCATLLGDFEISTEVTDGGVDGGLSAPDGEVDTGVVDANAARDGTAPDASNDGAAMANDGGSVGDAGIAPCDPLEVPPAGGTGIYVSEKTGTNAAGGGSGQPSTPFKSIKDALGVAKALGAPIVVLDEGTYAERVDLANFSKAIRIDGSWKRTGAVWSRDCSPQRADLTLIQSPDDVAVTVSDLAAGATLSNLAITTRGPLPPLPNQPGASRIAVFAKASVVALDNVHVVAAAATGGGAASAGTNGTASCVSSVSCVAVPAAGADRGVAPGATTNGAFTASGFAPANGQPGAQSGGAGQNGAPGGAANSRTDCEVDGQCAANGSSCNSKVGTVVSEVGRCGCGGTGGGPGAAGRGGGASVGIVAVGGTVTVKYSKIEAGNGGDGAPGGTGGAGGPGSAGIAGANAECWTADCCVCGVCPACGCYKQGNWSTCCGRPAPSNRPIAGGTKGGDGAGGGRGEAGGPGAGGPSFTYVPLAGAQVVFIDSQRAFGKGGSAPAGAAPGPSREFP